MSYTLFNFLDSIALNKVDLYEMDPVAFETDYNAFMVATGLGQHVDCILVANEMNKRPKVSKLMHYDYLRGAISKRKRYGKWIKPKPINEDVKMLSEYYETSMEKAEDILSILTHKQLENIKSSLNSKDEVTR